MSLFIKVSNINSSPILYRMRDLSLTFGKTNQGTLGNKDLIKSYFSVCLYKETYFVYPELPNIIFDTNPLSEPKAISISSTLITENYTFTFFPVSHTAELFAHLPEIPGEKILKFLEQKPALYLNYSLVNFQKSFPIFPDLELPLGSHYTHPLFVPLIASKHCTVCYKDGVVGVEEHEGEITFITSSTNNQISFLLQPVGMEVKFNSC